MISRRNGCLPSKCLSRSSRAYNCEFKRDAYFVLGVEQVWLVDWEREMVEVC
ncbi:MAG: hypothetical protein WD825_04680 [Gemmatimonadaceae bacterium]